ncbi:MCE family protein [Ilyomonas limi]|uniref:MCE family protein n=1 Tax=Ilyomonas limi TaxID=2575867 RepID=A0A4U3L0A3_9BACT|nr:MlaD family protein [Ilyomonas limi]TKK68511.1 MCE family protein [Ilyomonas limi]
MKISNETKIGALTVIAVALLILGFNFLKGKSFFKSGNFLYAIYKDTKALAPSNAVYMNGYQIGSVYEIEPANKTVTQLVVTIKLKESFDIPKNSVATINSNPLGSPSVEINPGNSSAYFKNEDTIRTAEESGLLGTLTNKMGPVVDQLTSTFHSLDSVLKNFNSILDPRVKGNLQSTVANINDATAALVTASASLNRLLDTQTGALAGTLGNLQSFSKNLAENNSTLTHTLQNVDSVTNNLAKADIQGVMNQLSTASARLDSAMAQLNSPKSSIGALLYDRQLYNNLNNTAISLHTLMDDLRVHPKRYVNISLFGKKDKGNYITSPLKQDTVVIIQQP